MGAWQNILNEFNLSESVEGNFMTLTGKTRGDRVIWSIVAVLVVISLLAVYSSTGSLAYKQNKGNTEYYLFRQTTFIVIGVGIIYFTHLVDYRWFSRLALWLYLLSIPLLLYTLLFGANLNEANRWIKLPLINLTFQTSDFARLALFMYLARQLSRKQHVITDFRKGFLPLLLPIGLTCLLIAPANLSTCLLTGATALLVMFMGRASLRHILVTIGVACIPIVILVAVAIINYDPVARQKDLAADGMVQTMRKTGRVGTWISRIQDFIYAEGDAVPYQVQQAKVAIAKGGWIGLGPGNSEQRNFLPHPYSDFIYAIIIEEYGFLGAFLIVSLYMALLFRCIRLVKRCPFAFGSFLALAVGITGAIQAISNMAVNVSLLPVTGVTLPLVSMGGTSFLFTCFSIGILLSVARNIEEAEGKPMETVPVVAEKQEEVPA
ncbi:MAG: FtsW/RodA/SpoVE family cell cycle protein [Chitinophagaceae bacterium]|nr:FtsW/RodA/SpoVE family cell cycle protein [Chitinophagaceae bacterium]